MNVAVACDMSAKTCGPELAGMLVTCLNTGFACAFLTK